MTSYTTTDFRWIRKLEKIQINFSTYIQILLLIKKISLTFPIVNTFHQWPFIHRNLRAIIFLFMVSYVFCGPILLHNFVLLYSSLKYLRIFLVYSFSSSVCVYGF